MVQGWCALNLEQYPTSRAATLLIENATAEHAGDYRCVATDVCGSVTSDPVTLTICTADFDGDGFVTGLDFDLYVAAFENGDTNADFDGDGFITGVDFDLYVQAFEAGC